MPALNKKMAVLQKLEKQNKPVSLPELLGEIEYAYPERSVRRWLTLMVSEGAVSKYGQKRGTKYQALKKNDYLDSCFSPASEQIIASIQRPIYDRLPVAYNDEWLESYQPNKSYYLDQHLRERLYQPLVENSHFDSARQSQIEALRSDRGSPSLFGKGDEEDRFGKAAASQNGNFQLAAGIYRAGKHTKHEYPAGTFAHQIFDRLLVDLSYNSSRLEGNTYSWLDTEKLLLSGVEADGKLDEEKLMILNHKEAIRFLVEAAPRLEVDVQTIFTVHYLLSDGLVESSMAGKIRNHAVRISGSTYIPYENQKKLAEFLHLIINKASRIKDAYEQSFFLLVHLSYLQAFTDVNKRNARICSNIPFIIRNLIPLSFNDVEREDFTSAIIALYELQDVRPLADLFAYSYLRSCQLYRATIKSIVFDEIRVRYRQHRRTLLREIIQNGLKGATLTNFVKKQAGKVPAKDRSNFIEDLHEDLRELDVSRIAGLGGVTSEELFKYLR